MCGIDDMDPLDFAFIAGLVEAQLEGEGRVEGEPKEPSPDDLLEYYDPISGENQIEAEEEKD